MKCSNVERGCEWVGAVAALEKHGATCDFTLLPCPKQCKYDDDSSDVKLFMRRDLNKHLKEDCPNRDYTCEYCGEKTTYAHTQLHDEVCPQKILPCPNTGCVNTMQRQHVEAHFTAECEYTVIPCKFNKLGCKIELKRKDMAAHEEDDKIHLHMAIVMAAELEKELQDTKDVTARLENKVALLEESMENALAKISILELAPQPNSVKGEDLMVFNISDYQMKKDMDTACQSSFYTSPEGYHMAIIVYANGKSSGKGTHVSIYVYMLKGENDDKLNWPFVGDITIILLNQLEDMNHFSKTLNIKAEYDIRPVQGKGKNRGYCNYIPHSELGYNPEKYTQYLKKNTLCFRVLFAIHTMS